MKTFDEILKKNIPEDEWDYFEICFLKDVSISQEEYASQFHPSPVQDVTDEEIKEWAKSKPKIFQHTEPLSTKLGIEVFNAIVNARIEGAKWYRTRQREKGETNPVFQKLKDKGLINESYVAMDRVNEICDKAEKGKVKGGKKDV